MMEDSSLIAEKKPSGFWEFMKAVIISVLIVIPVRTYIAQPFIVDGQSMEPNYQNGNYLIIDELSYQFREPARGEVIVFRYPLMPKQFFIKRIIGLPGELVEIKENTVRITTKEGKSFILDEPYIPKTFYTGPDMNPVTLGVDQYFVLGDNRSHSSDSRVWGILPKKNITGRTFVRLWPVNEISLLTN